MPQIEQYGDGQGSTVRTRPIDAPLINPNIATPDVFGAAIARGAGDAAQGLGQAYMMHQRLRQEEQDNRDEVEAFDGANQYIEQDNTDTANFLTRTGKQAIGLTEDARKTHQRRRDEIAAKLTSPGAKEKFNQLTERRWLQTQARLEGHAAGEVKNYIAQTYDSTITNVMMDGLNDGTPTALERAEAMARVTRQRQGDLLGGDGQTIELAHRKDSGKLYGAAVDAAIDRSDWATAAALVERYGDRLPEDKRADARGRIAAGGRNQQAQTTTDTILADPAITRAKAALAIKEIGDADLRDRVQQKANQEFERREAALNEARGTTYETMAKEIESGADVEDLLVKHQDAAALEQVDRDRLRVAAERAAVRKAPPAGSDEFYELRNMAAVTPGPFMDVDLRRYRGVINEGERKQMIELQADMKSHAIATAAKGSQKPARGFLSEEDVANGLLEKADIPTGVKDGKHDPRALSFKRQLNRAIVAAGGSTNVTTDQIEQIGKRLMAEEVRKVARAGLNPMRLFSGETYDEKVRSFEAEGADQRAFALSQVPASEVAKIRASLRKRGLTDDAITENDIIATYNATLSK